MIKIDLSKIVVNANDVVIKDEDGAARSYGFHLANALGFARENPRKYLALSRLISEGAGVFEVDESDAALLRDFCDRGIMINFIAGEIQSQIDKGFRDADAAKEKKDVGTESSSA